MRSVEWRGSGQVLRSGVSRNRCDESRSAFSAGWMNGENMTDQELFAKIDQVSRDYHGQVDDLAAVVGMLMVGRLYGWQVMRLATGRRHWALAIKLFGDPKEMMPPRTALSSKSVGLRLADTAGDFWQVIRGQVKTRKDDRAMLV